MMSRRNVLRRLIERERDLTMFGDVLRRHAVVNLRQKYEFAAGWLMMVLHEESRCLAYI